MIIDFEWKVIKVDFPFKVDDFNVDNKVEIPYPSSCYSRTDINNWFKTYKWGITLGHEPFFNGKENTNTVMRKIEQQRIKVNDEDYIDDFGFYVYFIVTEEPGLKDLRYD